MYCIKIKYANGASFQCCVICDTADEALVALKEIGIKEKPDVLMKIDDIKSPDGLKKKRISSFIIGCLKFIIYKPHGLVTWVYKRFDKPNYRMLNYVYNTNLQIYIIDKYLDERVLDYVKTVIGCSMGVYYDNITTIPYFYRKEVTKGNEKYTELDITPITNRNQKNSVLSAIIFPNKCTIEMIMKLIRDSSINCGNPIAYFYMDETALYEVTIENSILSFTQIWY